MNDLLNNGANWVTWAGVALAIAMSIRTYSSSSARSQRQLEKWLHEAQRKIETLEATIAGLLTELTAMRAQLADCSVQSKAQSALIAGLKEQLEIAIERATRIYAEWMEYRRAGEAGEGADRKRRESPDGPRVDDTGAHRALKGDE